MVDCVSSSSVGAGAVTFGFQPWSVSGVDSLAAGSSVLMIFTSPAVSAGVFAESGGAIVGFVMTGFGAAGTAFRVRFFRRLVCALPSTMQKLTTRHAAMRILT